MGKVVAKLPSGEFQKICRDLKEFGETMQVNASKDGIKFSVSGDVGAGNVVLKPRESDKPEEKMTLTVHEPVSATAALRHGGAWAWPRRAASGEVRPRDRGQRFHAIL